MHTFNHYTLIWYIDIIIKTFNIYILFREIAEAALVIWLAVLVSYMHILNKYIYNVCEPPSKSIVYMPGAKE
jgi:hypothetical protein